MPERVIKTYGKVVRIVDTGRPAMDVACNIIVQLRTKGMWRFHRGFSSISDDMANVNAQECAERLHKSWSK